VVGVVVRVVVMEVVVAGVVGAGVVVVCVEVWDSVELTDFGWATVKVIEAGTVKLNSASALIEFLQEQCADCACIINYTPGLFLVTN
jgi:hypothetical protein